MESWCMTPEKGASVEDVSWVVPNDPVLDLKVDQMQVGTWRMDMDEELKMSLNHWLQQLEAAQLLQLNRFRDAFLNDTKKLVERFQESSCCTEAEHRAARSPRTQDAFDLKFMEMSPDRKPWSRKREQRGNSNGFHASNSTSIGGQSSESEERLAFLRSKSIGGAPSTPPGQSSENEEKLAFLKSKSNGAIANGGTASSDGLHVISEDEKGGLERSSHTCALSGGFNASKVLFKESSAHDHSGEKSAGECRSVAGQLLKGDVRKSDLTTIYKLNQDKKKVKSPLRRFVGSFPFQLIFATLIVGNGVFVGYRTHVTALDSFEKAADNRSQSDDDINWLFFEYLFLIAFILELMLRVCAYKLEFFTGQERSWNVFDSTIVFLYIIEISLEDILLDGTSFKFFRLIRVARLLRLFSVLHRVRFFARLNMMVSSVLTSLNALAPAIVLLVLLMYLFAIWILQGVTNYVDQIDFQSNQDEIEELQVWWASLASAILTLTMTITSGTEWENCYNALEQVGALYQCALVFYVVFVHLAVLNILTGIFVDTVQQMYKPAREAIIEKEALERREYMRNIIELFNEADEDNSGTITWEEFESHLQDQRVQYYFRSLQLDASRAEEIFHLMDRKNSGEVDVRDFVEGFLSLRGYAKSVDVWLLRAQIMTAFEKIVDLVHPHGLQESMGVYAYTKMSSIRPEKIGSKLEIENSVDSPNGQIIQSGLSSPTTSEIDKLVG